MLTPINDTEFLSYYAFYNKLYSSSPFAVKGLILSGDSRNVGKELERTEFSPIDSSNNTAAFPTARSKSGMLFCNDGIF